VLNLKSALCDFVFLHEGKRQREKRDISLEVRVAFGLATMISDRSDLVPGAPFSNQMLIQREQLSKP
jgi:hypothetical protein